MTFSTLIDKYLIQTSSEKLQQMGRNTETFRHTLLRGRGLGAGGSTGTLEHIGLNGLSPSNPSPESSGNPLKKYQKQYKSHRAWRTPGEQGPFTQLN